MLGTLLVILTFGLVIFGGGTLLMVALRLPRLGITSALWLALWLVLALAVAMPFGWRAWVGDLTFLLLALGCGAVIYARRKSPLPALPYTPLDAAAFGVVALLFVIPALVLPVPLDTDAQGFGYLALMAREGSNLTTLAPFQPEIDYLYAPGFTVIAAYLSERLGTPLHSTQFGAAAVLAVLFLLAVYDFGLELGGVARARARAHLIAGIIGTGLFSAYMDSHYTSVIGLGLGVGFLTAVWWVVVPPSPQTPLPLGEGLHNPSHSPFSRWAGGMRAFVLMAALFLAALVLAHPDTTIIIGLGFGAWLLLMPLAQPRPTLRRWLTVAAGVPLLALVLILPWLLSVLHLLGSEIASPFERFPYHWRVVLGVPPHIIYHGGLITLLAIAGVAIGLRARRHEALLGLGWLLLVLDFSTFGILERTIPALIAPVKRYDYPFSIAWHGPIVPYVLLGGLALDAVWRRIVEARHAVPLRRVAYGVLGLAAVLMIVAGVFNREVLALSKGRVTFFGAFASHADVAAMTWLRENTAPDAYVLNFPGPQEGDWVPVIAERKAVYYRPQPFFQRGDDDPLADTPEQVAMRAFWQDPANPAHAEMLRAAGVDYVIVPQVVGNPASLAGHFRWRPPFTELIEMESAVREAPYLELVFDTDGARVYRIIEVD